MLYLSVFLFGMVAGVVVLVIQAHQPHGFKANNGKRYRLTEVR